MKCIKVNVKMNELAKRAHNRRIAHSSVKQAKDTALENQTFKDLETDIYKNIVVRSDYQ